MDWAGKQHPLETLAEWVAPLILAAAAGWAASAAGMSFLVNAVTPIATFGAGFGAIRLSGNDRRLFMPGFEPGAIEAAQPPGLGELLLEAKDELLILDDPLVDPESESRVVRLFERQEPTPGELVERIADFLGEGRKTAPPLTIQTQDIQPPDASAALHAALANIKASLR